MEHSPEEGASPEPSGQPPATDSTRDGGSGVPPAGPGAASEALAVLTSFGRRLLVLVPVYLAGAAGLSVGFVLFGLALYLGWRRVRDGKERSLRAARQLLDDEERITAETLYMSHRELPAWVSYHFSPWCSIALPSPSTWGSPTLQSQLPHLGQRAPRLCIVPLALVCWDAPLLDAATHSPRPPLPQSGSFHGIGTSSSVSSDYSSTSELPLPAKRVECSLLLTSGATRAFAALPLGIPPPPTPRWLRGSPAFASAFKAFYLLQGIRVFRFLPCL
jgi:hypothetical protein